MKVIKVLENRTAIYERTRYTVVVQARQGIPGPAGAEGAPGKPGPPGANGAGYVHSQQSADTQWVVNHNLGVRPSVSVTDTGGAELDAEVLHVSLNQLFILFNTPMAGLARIN